MKMTAVLATGDTLKAESISFNTVINHGRALQGWFFRRQGNVVTAQGFFQFEIYDK